MPITFDVLGREEFPEWNRFVRSSAVGTVFHTTEWLHCSSDRIRVVVCRDSGGMILGGLALVTIRRYGFTGYFPPQFTPYYGLVYSDKYQRHPLRHFSEYGRLVQGVLAATRPSLSMDLHCHPLTQNLQPFIWGGFSLRMGYTFELPGDHNAFEAGLFADRRKKLRIARAQMEAGDLRVEETEDENEIIQLISDTARHRGFRCDEGIARSILRHMRGHYKVFVARDRTGTAFQADVFVYDDSRGYLLMSGTAPGYTKHRGNVHILIISELVKVCERLRLVFDFEGSIIPPIAHYNRRFGATPRACWRAQKSRNPFHYAVRSIYRYVTREVTDISRPGAWVS